MKQPAITISGCLLMIFLAFHAEQTLAEQLLSQDDIDRYPLGSELHPVRAIGKDGEVEYIEGLDCDNGSIPMYRYVGGAGIGPYGNKLNKYLLQCDGEKTTVHEVYIDPHHEVKDTEAVPGFTTWL